MKDTIKTDRSTWSSPNPTAPAIESRVPIFAPILRVSHNSRPRTRRYETQWGWVELSGPVLTQEHRAIILIAKTMSIKFKNWNDGSMSLWVDALDVKKALGYHGGSGHKRFEQRIEEMRKVKLTSYSSSTKKIRNSGILSESEYSDIPKDEGMQKNREWMTVYKPSDVGKKTKEQIDIMFKGSHLREIKFSTNYMQFFREELRVHFDPLVPKIVQIPDGTIRAIILFFLTHEKGCQYSISKVMKIIGAIMEETDRADVSRIMAKPKKFKADLENFGIFVEGETLRYERHSKVFFTNPPLPAATGAVIDAEEAPEPTSSGTALEANTSGIVEPKALVK